MLKKISSLQSAQPLTKEDQKGIVAGRSATLTHADAYDVYCRCDDGSEWHVGTTGSSSRAQSMASQCSADGGSPYIIVF